MNLREYFDKKSLQFVISAAFTIITLIGLGTLGGSLYLSYIKSSRDIIANDNMQLVKQVDLNLSSYLRNMMMISDTMYYNIIKDKDIDMKNSASIERLNREMALLYEANRDYLVSITCVTKNGELVASVPLSNLKENVDVTKQDWFIKAEEKMENFHFSTAHVQNLFEENNYKYSWVISLSRWIELTSEGRTQTGVLLVDMNYSGIERMFSKANTNEMNYLYLVDNRGNIIYHPKQNLINANLVQENNKLAAAYEDGVHYETFEKEERMVIVKTVGYTGWKIVNVTPTANMSPSLTKNRVIWVVLIAIIALFMIFAINYITFWVTKPLRRLDASVKEIELQYSPSQIYIGGSYEVRHLGKTIRTMVEQMKALMGRLLKEQEEKRKSEMDALQSQINPHFLYNTLDSIVWMIESGQYKESISMVTALANLFRISLSQGKTIITVKDEISHARNYTSIQKVRYKNKFEVVFDIEKEIECYETIKLIVQPLLENAIYYGMEAMDEGEGLICVRGYSKGDDIFIEVSDNGMGMSAEMVENLLTDSKRIRKKGSGIGIHNVHERIQLYFGKEYGLKIESEPDEGTTVIIHLPKRIGGTYEV